MLLTHSFIHSFNIKNGDEKHTYSVPCSILGATNIAVNTRDKTLCSWRAYIRLELKIKFLDIYWAFQVALLVKNLSANKGDVRGTGLIHGGKDP